MATETVSYRLKMGHIWTTYRTFFWSHKRATFGSQFADRDVLFIFVASMHPELQIFKDDLAFFKVKILGKFFYATSIKVKNSNTRMVKSHRTLSLWYIPWWNEEPCTPECYAMCAVWLAMLAQFDRAFSNAVSSTYQLSSI